MFWLSKKHIAILLMLPALLLYVLYIIIPIIMAFFYSFTKFSGIGEPEFVGLKNYARLLKDPLFLVSLKNTFIILAVSFVLLLVGSFLLAVLLNTKIKGANAAKALIFSPAIIAPIVVGLIWSFILDPYTGLINMFLKKVGLDFIALKWIGGVTLTPYVIGVVYTWQVLGFITTIFIAGLKLIPQNIYEAASIDGANPRQELFFITIPMLKQTFLINVVLIITGCFKIFEVVFQLTGGGPNHFSEVLVTYMYNTSFQYSEYGYGMSIAVVTFLLSIMFFSVYLLVIMKRKEE